MTSPGPAPRLPQRSATPAAGLPPGLHRRWPRVLVMMKAAGAQSAERVARAPANQRLSTKTVSYMVGWSFDWLWGVGGGDGSCRMACGRSPGHCCRRRGCGRRVAGSRTSMTRRCSPRSSMCWSAAVPGGRCRRASGRRSRPCTAGFSSGPVPGCGDDCTRRCSSSWTARTSSTCRALSSTPLTSALKRGRTCRSEPRGPG